MKRWAIVSNCLLYRPLLGRSTEAWKLPMPFIFWVLNNPSVADANQDDPTVDKLWGYTQLWGYQCMTLANTNPFRATDPSQAEIPPESTMAVNDMYLLNEGAAAAMIICAWGNRANPDLAKRALFQLAPLKPLYAMRLNKNGTPSHPLYLPGALKPTRWSPTQWQH